MCTTEHCESKLFEKLKENQCDGFNPEEKPNRYLAKVIQKTCKTFLVPLYPSLKDGINMDSSFLSKVLKVKILSDRKSP